MPSTYEVNSMRVFPPLCKIVSKLTKTTWIVRPVNRKTTIRHALHCIQDAAAMYLM